jgi:hypothetical protein
MIFNLSEALERGPTGEKLQLTGSCDGLELGQDKVPVFFHALVVPLHLPAPRTIIFIWKPAWKMKQIILNLNFFQYFSEYICRYNRIPILIKRTNNFVLNKLNVFFFSGRYEKSFRERQIYNICLIFNLLIV